MWPWVLAVSPDPGVGLLCDLRNLRSILPVTISSPKE